MSNRQSTAAKSRPGAGLTRQTTIKRTNSSSSLGYKSKKLLRMTMPNPSDMRQSMLALFMISFFCSSMSLVWSFSVMVPFLKCQNYKSEECRLIGVNGVPQKCENHSYFQNLNFSNPTNTGVGHLKLKKKMRKIEY